MKIIQPPAPASCRCSRWRVPPAPGVAHPELPRYNCRHQAVELQVVCPHHLDTVLGRFVRRTYPEATAEVLLFQQAPMPVMAADRDEPLAYGRCIRMDVVDGIPRRCAYVLKLGRDKAAPAVDHLWRWAMETVGPRAVCRVQMTEAEMSTIN